MNGWPLKAVVPDVKVSPCVEAEEGRGRALSARKAETVKKKSDLDWTTLANCPVLRCSLHCSITFSSHWKSSRYESHAENEESD